MQHMAGPLTFKYPSWHPWSSAPGTVVLGVLIILYILFIKYPASIDQAIAYWVILVVLAALLALSARQLMQDIVRPHTVIASDEGITGLRVVGAPVRMTWREIDEVTQREEGIRFIGLRRPTLKLCSHDDEMRTLSVDTRLPGYLDLLHLVLQRTTRSESPGENTP